MPKYYLLTLQWTDDSVNYYKEMLICEGCPLDFLVRLKTDIPDRKFILLNSLEITKEQAFKYKDMF